MFNGKVSVREASEMLDLSQKYLRTLAEQRRIPFYKPFGGKIYFSIEELEKYFKDNRYRAIDELTNPPQ